MQYKGTTKLMSLIKRLIFKCRETLTDKESQTSFSVERCIYAPVHVSIKMIDLLLTDETTQKVFLAKVRFI